MKGRVTTMVEEGRAADESAGDYLQFHLAGERAKGEFRCSECGYGVAVFKDLPLCPMCGGTVWEDSAWSPFGPVHGPLV
jgi:rubrerythrin